MTSIRLRDNQVKDHNAEHFSRTQLFRVFYPLRLNYQQKLRESDFLYCY